MNIRCRDGQVHIFQQCANDLLSLKQNEPFSDMAALRDRFVSVPSDGEKYLSLARSLAVEADKLLIAIPTARVSEQANQNRIGTLAYYMQRRRCVGIKLIMVAWHLAHRRGYSDTEK